MKAFLKAGILTEDRLREDTTAGTPQGGILSPLLANVARSTLDEYIANAPLFNPQSGRKRAPQLTCWSLSLWVSVGVGRT